jgi:hypothetical protein
MLGAVIVYVGFNGRCGSYRGGFAAVKSARLAQLALLAREVHR